MSSSRSAIVSILVLLLVTTVAPISQENTPDLFYSAIRSNDLPKLTALLRGGADVNTKDERGITPLMAAAWVGSTEAMKLLLDKGADPNLTNSNGSTALMLAITQIDKVRLLVDRGADVNIVAKSGRTALLLAAMSDGSAPIVRLLIAKGANVKVVDAVKTTPLIAATRGNDTETVRLLVAAGNDVNAADFLGLTPLMNAAAQLNLESIRLLLSKGANVNAVSLPPMIKVKAGTVALGNFTALMMAAPSGPVDVIKALLDAGANVNAQDGRGLTPLMLALGTDRQNADEIRMLLAKGAHVNVKSVTGETALDWADKAGFTESIDMLQKAGAVRTSPHQPAVPSFAPADLRTSAQRSVALLEKTAIGAAANGGCASCHSHNITDVVVRLASAKGLNIDSKAAADRRQLTRVPYFSPLNMLERIDGPGSPDVALFALGGLAANGQQPDRLTDAVLANVAAQQSASGKWYRAIGAVARPPIEDGDITRTTLGIGALKEFASPARADYAERIQRAKRWLAAATPTTTEDRNMQLVGLECAGAEKSVLQRLAKAIVAAQQPDGGWTQRPPFKSDAYATGQTLFALASTGMLSPRDPVYQKGVKFLLSTQHADGSWYVRSRSPKFQPYFESGFPYAHDQWISSMATGWGAAALALALEEPQTASRTTTR